MAVLTKIGTLKTHCVSRWIIWKGFLKWTNFSWIPSKTFWESGQKTSGGVVKIALDVPKKYVFRKQTFAKTFQRFRTSSERFSNFEQKFQLCKRFRTLGKKLLPWLSKLPSTCLETFWRNVFFCERFLNFFHFERKHFALTDDFCRCYCLNFILGVQSFFSRFLEKTWTFPIRIGKTGGKKSTCPGEEFF